MADVTGVARIPFMFSVATLTLASPVYLRLWEGPGPGGMLRLVLLLQVLPTAALVLADVWLHRRWRRAWPGWRSALLVISILAVARQAQIYFRTPTSPVGWMLVAACLVAILGIPRVSGVSPSRFLAAFAPGVLVWTLVTGYALLPTSERTVRHAPPSPPAVFVLLFDELDRDVVMPGGRVRDELPNFRRLVERSRAYADATANYGITCPSVASLLSGRLFERPTPTSRDCLRHTPGFREDNLLSEVARRLTVRVHGQYLAYCFDRAFECRGTAYVQARAPQLALLQHYVPDVLRTALGAQRILGSSEHTYTLPVFQQFLDGVRAADARGTFHWLHVLLPHGPYVFDAMGGTRPLAYRAYWWDPAEYRRALGAYRRQVAFADVLLGRFLDRLDAEGLAHDAVVIVTADHGFHSLRPQGEPEWIDGFEVRAARPRVPLIIRAPGVAPGVTADEYQHVDFKRLVLGLIDGAGLPEPISPPRDKIFCDTTTWLVRDAARRWRPQAPSGPSAPACGSDVEPLR